MEQRAQDFPAWLDENISKFELLTDSVVSILRSLLDEYNIEYLSVSGRTKSFDGCMEKLNRKKYKNPMSQMTDISGIRIIVYYEGVIPAVSEIIKSAFRIDEANSSNTASRMSTDQVGYRSVHFVCDIGEKRAALPEFRRLSGLKFEIQLRTVLQHAWAEMAHDRNYKFRGTLPPSMERQLFLLAGLLETADRGFEELSVTIDQYRATLEVNEVSDLSENRIDVISLDVFVQKWANDNNISFPNKTRKFFLDEVIKELEQYGINTIEELEGIIPDGYAKAVKDVGEPVIPASVVRDWMMLHDTKRFLKKVDVNWVIDDSVDSALQALMPAKDFERLCGTLMYN